MLPENFVALFPEWFQTKTNKKFIWGIQFRSLSLELSIFSRWNNIDTTKHSMLRNKHIYKKQQFMNSLSPLYSTTDINHLFRKL